MVGLAINSASVAMALTLTARGELWAAPLGIIAAGLEVFRWWRGF
jgi:hypothetical protein